MTVELLGTVVATGCANLGVTIHLDAAQAARAQALLPPGFALRRWPTLLVETSSCEAVSLDGAGIGPARLSEAALSIDPPLRVVGERLRERIVEDIYMLSQLDENPELSAFKAAAGYRTEITDIVLRRPAVRGLIGGRASARAGGVLAPSVATAWLSRSLLPARVTVRNPGIVFKLWTVDDAGRIAVTTNVNHGISRPALGLGTVRVAPGTPLHQLLGSGTATGVAFAGCAKGFVNDTFVASDRAVCAPG